MLCERVPLSGSESSRAGLAGADLQTPCRHFIHNLLLVGFFFHGRRGCGCKINLRVFFFFFSPKKSLCCNAGRAQADDIFMGLTLVKTVVSTRANQRVG